MKCGRGKGERRPGAIFMHFLSREVKKLTGTEEVSERLTAWAAWGLLIPRSEVGFFSISCKLGRKIKGAH